MKCGVEDKVQVFLFCFLAALLRNVSRMELNVSEALICKQSPGDTQIVKEDFVEAINNVLNSL